MATFKEIQMSKKINKYTIIALIVGVVIGILACVLVKYFQYDYQWILGKHYEEIIAMYGEFDSGKAEFVDEEKRWSTFNSTRNYSRGYHCIPIRCKNAGTYEVWSLFEAQVGVNDKIIYPHIIIEFDSQGYAISVSKGYYEYVGG